MNAGLTTILTVLAGFLMIPSIACSRPSDPTQASPIPTMPVDLATPVPDGQKDAEGDTDALREAQAQLDKHRLLRTSNRVDAYSFVLAPICFCP